MPGTMTETPESLQPGFPFTWVNKLGEHDYDIKDFGLTEGRVRDHFADYCEHFGV
jgi:hypothetical protein